MAATVFPSNVRAIQGSLDFVSRTALKEGKLLLDQQQHRKAALPKTSLPTPKEF
jgi:hypothetical protein